MGAGGVVGEVVGGGAAGYSGGRGHGYLVDVVPERTEVETVRRGLAFAIAVWEFGERKEVVLVGAAD